AGDLTPVRVRAQLVEGDLAVADEIHHHGMVAGEGGDLRVAEQVDAAVADVGEGKAAVEETGAGEGAAAAGVLGVERLADAGVGGVDQVGNQADVLRA